MKTLPATGEFFAAEDYDVNSNISQVWRIVTKKILKIVLTDQLDRLNAQAEDGFAPSFKVLDEVIQSIQIGQ